MNILNYQRVDDLLSTSGQPREEDFAAIAAQGFRTVINLALPESEGAIADEGALVAAHRMNYFHIPVLWEAPRVDQFRTFCHLMEHAAGEKTWVHCARNMRVSCFVYLYQTEVLGRPEPEARALMNRIWDPDEFPAWRRFIDEVRQAGV